MSKVVLLGFVTGVSWEVAELELVELVLGFSEPVVNRCVDVVVDVAGAVAGAAVIRRLLGAAYNPAQAR
jgi:hypothetical protein